MFRKIITLLVLTIIAAASICFVTSPAAQAFDPVSANPSILEEAASRALEQGYGERVPVKVGGKTFAYNDVSGITYAIRQLAIETGDEAVITSAANINSCYLLVMNGKWFANISNSLNQEFYAAFPGHSKSDYNAAVKKAQNKQAEIFDQICRERGLDENGYPKSASTPKPTASPVTTPKPSETKAPVTTPKPTTKPKATESPKAEGNPKATEKPKATQTPVPESVAVASSDTTPNPGVAPEPSVSAAVEPVATPSAASAVQTVQVDMSEASTSLNEQSANDKPAAVTVLSASTVADSGDTVTIELKTSELPEGTASIKTPDGQIIQVSSTESTIKIKVNKSDLNSDGRIKVVTLGEEGTPLGTFEIQTEMKPSSGLLWLWIAIGVIVAGAVICAVILGKKKRPLKAE